MRTNYVVCCRRKHENQEEKPVPFGRYPVLVPFGRYAVLTVVFIRYAVLTVVLYGMRVDGSFYTV